jgi:hypothetical protein
MSLNFRIQLEKGFAAKFKKDVETEIRNTILKTKSNISYRETDSNIGCFEIRSSS